jgi:DNA-binding NtrC family response regulator
MATIFVLEDDPDLLNLYTRALSFQGHDVESADSAESAIGMFAAGDCKPDIAVLDMSMPGLPGSAVVDYIRQKSEFPHVPIIVISCDESFRQILQSSRVTFMTKPINLTDLYTAVDKVTKVTA